MKIMSSSKKNQKGFTLVELIVVVAIIGIIGALLVPSYNNMSSKARLTTDISTVKTLQRVADVYKAEQGNYPDATTGEQLAEELIEKGYLESEIEIQTKADVVFNDGQVKLNVASLNVKEYGKAYEQMGEATTNIWCTGEMDGQIAEEKETGNQTTSGETGAEDKEPN